MMYTVRDRSAKDIQRISFVKDWTWQVAWNMRAFEAIDVPTLSSELNKDVCLRGRLYIHTCRCGVANWNIHCPSRAGRFVRFWATVGAKFPEMWDSIPAQDADEPPCSAKCDAASFILGGEILNGVNRTNAQTKSRQRVTDISTPCLSDGMCV